VREGDDYVVTGTKQFISGGGENDVYVTMVRTGEDGPKGISCLVIEKDMPGVSFGAQERKLGWHSQPTAQLIFDGVRVPVANLVGAEGQTASRSRWRAGRRAAQHRRLLAWAGRSAASTKR
jgi:alkylation response protein AidB-like acyl-CoA dehydrogenase